MIATPTDSYDRRLCIVTTFCWKIEQLTKANNNKYRII